MRSPVKPKDKVTNEFITDLVHQENNKSLRKEEPQLKEFPTFTGEGEYDHMSFIKTNDILQEYYIITDELITARLNSVFEKSEDKYYDGMRQANGKNTCSRCKSEIVTKWENDSWRYKIVNAFENQLFYPEKEKPGTWFLKNV
ncbi:hypothetical protein O181_006943 [Austropuccinia psidii MF-1]|uniref:Uncharacterized protein n=1 Tax=Austropuccinia psidii MF-1 TaxID=1389203 RepID=A0A9Q3GH29_9BASI|nr:hypothetical protein [Austropuccinia psidii MF-1]